MGFILRQIDPNAKLTDEIALEALWGVIPQEHLHAVVHQCHAQEERTRKLPTHVVLLLAIAMNLFTRASLSQVLVKLIKGLRFIWPDPGVVPASKGAISQARYRVGAQPVVRLFKELAQPMATEETLGAFLFGLRLMAIDGTREDVPDTPENGRVFGYPSGGRGQGAFPQIQGLYLVECGTHALCDAGFWPCSTSEHTGAQRLLRSVKAGMLLMWDRGLHSFDMAQKTRVQGAHFLGRLPSHVKPTVVRLLDDGSYLGRILPSDYQRRRRGEHLVVRVIEYTLDDPSRPGHQQRHRLMSSLLAPKQYPALDLVCAYHERWEIEITIDEIDTHQRLVGRPLRSQKPVGVLQEVYGLLLAHYAVRAVMHDAALAAVLDPDRLSFTNAVHLICDAVAEFQMVWPPQRATLYRRLLEDIARYRLPKRANRSNPRVVKKKMSNFKRKRAEHHAWPQLSKPFRETVVLLN